MKDLKEYLITEHYVNCKNQEEMQQYGEIVWNLLQSAYAYCGGIKNVDTVDELIADSHLWKLYRKNGEIKAVMTYTDRKGGRKLCLMGSDGSEEGRKQLKRMLEDDFRLKDRNTWTGASGKAAITALKHGGIPIPAAIACELMNAKKPGLCKPYDDWWYERPLKGEDGKMEVHYKLLLGNPPGYENFEAPKELVDMLIKQAEEFGA